jgi:hypothetical protein
MALAELIESRIFGAHDMAHPRRLMTVLRDQTGIPASAIERTIAKLTDVGWLPSGTDYLPRDAAMVLVAMAASRSPSEAVAAVEAYQDASLQMMRVFHDGNWQPVDLTNPELSINADPAASPARENVITAVGMFISEMILKFPAGGAPPMHVEIIRSAHHPLAVIRIDTENPVQMIFHRNDGYRASDAWETVQNLGPTLFAAVAAIFSNREPQPDERRPALLN